MSEASMIITQSDARAGTATSAATARTPACCQKRQEYYRKPKNFSEHFHSGSIKKSSSAFFWPSTNTSTYQGPANLKPKILWEKDDSKKIQE